MRTMVRGWMKVGVVMICALGFAASPARAEYEPTGEDFKKGALSGKEWQFSTMAGIGIIASDLGFAVAPAIAKKIVHHGFAPEINNQVYAELQVAPVIGIRGETPLFFSGHLRWNFTKDEQYTLYAVGGLAGHFGGLPVDGFFPRFGLGVMIDIGNGLAVRGEASHELTMVGLTISL